MRVGGNQTIKVDFRCMAATNKELEALVKAGSFRPDLYYRLHVLCIDLPPLRESREDVPLLVDFFVKKFCANTNRSTMPRISAEAMDLLMSYEWPGNVRELENAVERALVIGRGTELTPANFFFQLKATNGAGGGPHARRCRAGAHRAGLAGVPGQPLTRGAHPRHRPDDFLQQASPVRIEVSREARQRGRGRNEMADAQLANGRRRGRRAARSARPHRGVAGAHFRVFLPGGG